MKLDTVISNANIHTLDSFRPQASQIAIWNGQIVAIDEEVDHLLAATSKIGQAQPDFYDAAGATVLPGFNDVHSHSVWFGQTLTELNLENLTAPQDVYVAIKNHVDHNLDLDWIICSGFNPVHLVHDLSIDALESASQGKPLLIKHVSGHAYTVNSAALRIAGIDEYPKSQPVGGEIVTDADGRATGLLDENAMRPIQSVLQPESQSEIINALAAASQHYLTEGITSVTDAGIAGGWIGHSPQEFRAYQQALDNNLLRTRHQTMITLDALHSISGHQDDTVIQGLDTGLRSGIGNANLQIGPVKVFTDGSLLGRTAAMTEDYIGCPHNHGYLQGDPERMREEVVNAAAGGWALALHAIGDAAVDFALDSIEVARTQTPRKSGMPDRIEHGGAVRDDQLKRMAELDVVLVPQPYFISSFGDAMASRLGSERTNLSYPARRVLEAGLTLPGSSDRPVAHGAPLAVMQAFVERLTETGAAYGPDDRISIEQAISAYTVGSAAATGWSKLKGQLKSGMLADLVVLDEDPTKVDTHEISQIPVSATMVGGNFEYGNIKQL